MISYEHLGMTFRGVDHARSTLGHPKPGVYLKRSRLQSFKPTVSETSGDARMRSNPTTLITSEEYAEAYIKGYRKTLLLMRRGAGSDNAEELAQSAWVRGLNFATSYRIRQF